MERLLLPRPFLSNLKSIDMKLIQIFGLLTVVLLLSASVAMIKQNLPAQSAVGTTVAGDGFAVLELFTSEGCSSCPPADALMGSIQEQYKDKPVYVLSYHVDYWDRMGWKDVFSSAKNTDRQYRYSQSLRSQVYTPQLVVNGKKEFIGADKAKTTEALHAALNGTPAVTLDLKASPSLGKMQIDYAVSGKIAESKLLIALVQKHAVSKIKRGENEGRTLDHWQIVRKLYTFELDSAKGEKEFSLPEDYDAQGWEMIGFVQNPENGIISAASRAVFGQSASVDLEPQY